MTQYKTITESNNFIVLDIVGWAKAHPTKTKKAKALRNHS